MAGKTNQVVAVTQSNSLLHAAFGTDPLARLRSGPEEILGRHLLGAAL